MSQFVDKHDDRTLWSHEESFRRKTRNVVNTMLEKQKKDRELALPLLNNLGVHVGKTGSAVVDLEKKIGKTMMTTTGSLFTGPLTTPAGSNPTPSGVKPQTAFGGLMSQLRGNSGKKPNKAY